MSPAQVDAAPVGGAPPVTCAAPAGVRAVPMCGSPDLQDLGNKPLPCWCSNKGRHGVAQTELNEKQVEALIYGVHAARKRLREGRDWALGRPAGELIPAHLVGQGRERFFETSVVALTAEVMCVVLPSAFDGLIWERPYRLGDAVKRIDLALFADGGKLEVRLEFGEFTPSKVELDASKLAELADAEETSRVGNFDVGLPADGSSVQHTASYLILWQRTPAITNWGESIDNALTRAPHRSRPTRCMRHAVKRWRA